MHPQGKHVAVCGRSTGVVLIGDVVTVRFPIKRDLIVQGRRKRSLRRLGIYGGTRRVQTACVGIVQRNPQLSTGRRELNGLWQEIGQELRILRDQVKFHFLARKDRGFPVQRVACSYYGHQGGEVGQIVDLNGRGRIKSAIRTDNDGNITIDRRNLLVTPVGVYLNARSE